VRLLPRRAADGRLRRRDRGAIGVFVAVMALPLIGLIGLVYDGGLALEGRQRALDLAEQAARAAANDCDLTVLRERSVCEITRGPGGTEAKARQDAEAITNVNKVTLEDFGLTDCNNVGCFTVVVRTRVQVETVFLGLFGVNQFDIVLAERRATAVTGLA
jgi:hypothetical protein